MTMKNESGRSMVEMLGVLAIIGVLSIGGIAGYTMAMNRYRANEIIDTASKVAIIAMTSNAGVGADADISNLGSNISVPCIAADDGIKSDRYGSVTINVDSDCTGVADVIGTLASSRGSCSGNTCTLDFGDAS